MAFFDWHDRVAKLRDNRLIATGEYSELVTSRSGCIGIVVRVPDLRYIEHVIDVEFTLQGFNCTNNYLMGPEMNKTINGNLVGMSLYIITTGNTLTTKVVAIGPP